MSLEAGLIQQTKNKINRPPTSIVNWCSGGGVAQALIVFQVGASGGGAKTILSGAMTANTLKTLLSVTGQGEINILTLQALDTTSRTLRLRVTIDGIVAFDATSSALTSATSGLAAIGIFNAGNPSPQRVSFNSSFLVEAASSLAETNLAGLSIAYILT